MQLNFHAVLCVKRQAKHLITSNPRLQLAFNGSTTNQSIIRHGVTTHPSMLDQIKCFKSFLPKAHLTHQFGIELLK